LVHPDRLRTPLRREGPRGSGRWTAITWDEALEAIAAPLRQLRLEGHPERFVVLERGDSPLTRLWLDRAMRAYGSPNLVLDGTNETWRAAWAYVAGASHPPAADLAHSDFILSVGHELFETDGHPVWQSKVWGRLRAPAVARPTVLAYVGTRVSPTAARADLRTAVRPGQEATLVLGLVHILIMENLIDRPFLERWTSGHREPAAGPGVQGPGFESFVRRRYTPEEVSRRTGVPVSEIFRLGRAYGAARRPIALVGPSLLRGEDGLAVAMAVVALNLAVGSVGRAGGYVSGGGAPLALPVPTSPDEVARRGLASPRIDGAASATLGAIAHSPGRLIENLASGKPYPAGVLIVHGTNPLHEWAGGRTLEQAFANVGLVATTCRVLDETAFSADLVLPETSYLESWGMLPSPSLLPIDYVGLQQPAVDPLYHSRSFEDAWFALARRVGGPVAAAVPAGTYAQWLPEAARGLLEAGRGTLAGSEFQGRIADFMESRGWKVAGPGTPAAFWEALRQSGAWVDVPRSERSPADVLGAGVERFGFWPAALLGEAARLAGAPVPAEVIYTGHEAPAGGATDLDAGAGAFSLRLLLFDTNTMWGGRTALTPLMLEMTGHREDIAWDSWVEIHPDTAKRLRVESGDRVRVDSPAGSLVTRARLAQVVPTDAVAMLRGLGHRHFGRFASGVGANPLSLVPAGVDRWTGAAVTAVRVRIAPAPA
jgi:anaerobic selenocysteine-containing dehydrogenase